MEDNKVREAFETLRDAINKKDESIHARIDYIRDEKIPTKRIEEEHRHKHVMAIRRLLDVGAYLGCLK